MTDREKRDDEAPEEPSGFWKGVLLGMFGDIVDEW